MFVSWILPALLSVVPALAQEFDPSLITWPQVRVCEGLLGQFRDHAVTPDRIERTLARHSDVRTLYRSDTPGANLILVISKHREIRTALVGDVATFLGLPVFLPGRNVNLPRLPRHGSLNPYEVPPGLINALAMVENIGDVAPSYWDEGDTFLSHWEMHLLPRTHTCRHTSVVTVGLVQSESEFGDWANRPLRTLLDHVRRQSGNDLGPEAVRRLAGIYYVGRAHEILHDQFNN